MSKLTNENKARHAVSVASIIPKKVPVMYHPVQRVGTTRTADGAVFLLRDPSKVGKIVFYGTERGRRQIMNEFRIGQKMGEIGVGPKVYGYFKIKGINLVKLPMNLLSKGSKLDRNAIFIVMQNLGYGVKKIETLNEYVRLGNPYPYGQMKSVYDRMIHRHGVKNMMLLHGNLHMGNVIVRTFMNGKKRVYFIDFGRSMYIPYEGNTRNTLLSAGYKPHPNAPGYYTCPKTRVAKGINTNIVARNIAHYGVALRKYKNTPRTIADKRRQRTQKKMMSITNK
jgi:predicted Ser/Thr protein kinase